MKAGCSSHLNLLNDEAAFECVYRSTLGACRLEHCQQMLAMTSHTCVMCLNDLPFQVMTVVIQRVRLLVRFSIGSPQHGNTGLFTNKAELGILSFDANEKKKIFVNIYDGRLNGELLLCGVYIKRQTLPLCGVIS